MLDVGHDAATTAWLGRIAMSSPHRPLDRRSGLVLDTHELGRRAGAMKLVRTTAPAPADLGIAVIGVPPGSPVELDLRLESVIEGVLVTGTATVQVRGECVRCLGEVSDELEVDIQELFVYPGSDATEDEASRLEGWGTLLGPPLARRPGRVWRCPCRPSRSAGRTARGCAPSAVPTSTWT